MRVQVIFASFLMLTISLAGCITDSTVEQIADDITEVLGCMEESALNFDENATTSSDLCLSEEQLLLAEEVFWSSWDADAVNNATEPVGYRLMLEETSEDENESRSLDIQEVFSSDYYDQKILLRHGDGFTEDMPAVGSVNACRNAASSLGLIDEIKDDDKVEFEVCHYSSQIVFDDLVQVEKYSGSEWDNYSMENAATYDGFRNRLEHGPGIRSSGVVASSDASVDDDGTDGREGGPRGAFTIMVINPKDGNNSALFPSVNETEFESIDFREVELRGSGRTQTIYYFAKDTSTGNEVEVMGEMTEDGFRIIEYCNEIIDTNETIIYNLIDPEEIDGSSESVEKGVNNSRVVRKKPGIISARIILLEVDGDKMHFEEYQYAAPIEYGLMHMKAIPFYFEVIPDLDSNKSGNASNYGDGKKGLNAVNVKVVIAGPSGPFGMEGDLSDYRLVTSNCTLDNATTGVDETTEADEEATSGRSENATRDAVSELPAGKRVYGSDGNTCTNIDVYDLADLLAGSGNGTEHHNMYDPGHVYLFTFIDADSSGTLSEGDRFEFSENYTCDGCDEANMVRLFSISADEFSDGNINPSSEMSAVHDGAMDAIRNIRAVVPSPRSAVCCILAALAISR